MEEEEEEERSVRLRIATAVQPPWKREKADTLRERERERIFSSACSPCQPALLFIGLNNQDNIASPPKWVIKDKTLVIMNFNLFIKLN